MRSLYAVDTMAVIYRSHFAMIRAPLINSKGVNLSGLNGLLHTLFGIIERRKPDYLAVVTDTPEPTFRHKKYAEYKATREKMPEELVSQLSYIPRIVEALKLPYVALPGFEADDIIGTLVKEARKRKLEAFMVTGDKDYMQLIDKHAVMYASKGDEVTITGEDGVREKFGCTPDQVIEVLALMGDSSDNVPGVRGVGPKTATKLIEQFGTLEKLYANLDQVKGDKLKQSLAEHKADAFLSRELVTIDQDVPLPIKFDELAVHPDGLSNNPELIELLTELEFQSLRDKLIKKAAAAEARVPHTGRRPERACGLTPARTSKAAPTPSMTAGIRPRWAAIQRSCFGVLRPTKRMRAPEARIRRTTTSSSAGERGRNGGE